MSKTGNNDMGWWSDPETVDPPYLDPDPGQQGSTLEFFPCSQAGYASGQYPDGTACASDNDSPAVGGRPS
jgi:hypothetical protein